MRGVYIACLVLISLIQASAQESLLSTGDWFHFTTHQDGVHVLSFDDLESLGILESHVESDIISIFSHGPGILPEENWIPRPSDPVEIPIKMVDGNDGIFGPGDYLLFYGSDQTTWSYDMEENRFRHQTHLYDDHTHYFLNFGSGAGLRLSTDNQLQLPITHETSSFRDRQFHETEQHNIHSSGKKWYGENFDEILTHNFEFTFPNVNPEVSASCTVDLVSKCYGNGNTNEFIVSVANHASSFEVINISDNYLSDLVRPGNHHFNFTMDEDVATVSITMNPHNNYSAAWLNFIILEAERELIIPENGQLHFRQTEGLQTNGSTLYHLQNFTSAHSVWDITNFYLPIEKTVSGAGSNATIEASNNLLRDFVCFTPNDLISPEYVGPLVNQSLKSQPQANGFIVTHPDFLAQAMQLAQFHETNNGLTVNVATTEQIYLEFSGGSKDITAIKDYVRYFYDQAGAPDQKPEYLCLLGDASFDYKGHIYPGSDFVPTFESEKSFALITSYCSDDYFGLLDVSASNELLDETELGIGRLPARTVEEAQIMINKIIAYHSPVSHGEWQYNAIFIADDEDNNLHMNQSNLLAGYLENSNCALNIKKIFFDAYEQVPNPSGGDSYPGATADIISGIESGAFICNYTGHSGFSNWSAEKVMVDTMFAQLQNEHLPIFFMANCEFSKYDAPQHTTGSELMMFNPNGGAIACVSNARPGYSSANFNVNHQFNNHIFNHSNGVYPRIGDIIRYTKNNSITGNGITHRSINLMGDPMTRLNYPELNLAVTHVAGENTGSDTFTFGFSSEIEFTGEVLNFDGSTEYNFDGAMSYVILDSKMPVITLGNDGFAPFNYSVRVDTVASGTTEITSGAFSFNAFIENNGNGFSGNGKMLMFATDQNISATGCFTDFVVHQSPVGIADGPALKATFYPNPVQETLRIELTENSGSFNYTLYNLAGEFLLRQESIAEKFVEIPMQHLSAGNYFVRIESAGQSATVKVIKL